VIELIAAEIGGVEREDFRMSLRLYHPGSFSLEVQFSALMSTT
jgi:hypothetical protein